MTAPTVLVVDDDPGAADLHGSYLEPEYVVRPAYGGEEALERLDDQVDVVLLDRRMPEVSGEAVLEAVRECQPNCRVIMLTAMEPDFDIIDLSIDEYLVKPVDPEALRRAIDRLVSRAAYHDLVREYYQLSAATAALSAHHPSDELESNEEFRDLRRRLTDVHGRLSAISDEFEPRDFQFLFRDLDRPAEPSN